MSPNRAAVSGLALFVAIELGVVFLATDVLIGRAALASIGVALALSLLAHRRRNRLVRVLLGSVVALALLSFGWTLAQEFTLGGTPLNGKIEDGRHYVGSHGHYREVSPRLYRFGLLPNLGIVIFGPILFLVPGLVSYAGRASPDGSRAGRAKGPGTSRPDEDRI